MKKNDLFISETISNILNYMENGEKLDQKNVEDYLLGKPVQPTFRIRNNRIVRKEIRGKIRYFLQMVLEGTPVSKRKKDGSFRHTFGVGRVGGDIGTQSLAIVSKEQVWLKNLAERSQNTLEMERNIVRMQRYLDRSRRSLNPENYNSDDTIKKGKKNRIYSNRYVREKKKLKNLQRKAAASRKYAHNGDINRLRSIGDEFIIETMNIKALQKRAKTSEKSEKTGKWKRRKRYGKSILKRSPGYFIQQAKYRFSLTCGKVTEVNTWTFKASQYDHVLDQASKKQLSKRWHTLPDGTNIQRDLYSAFLLFYSNDEWLKPDNKLCQVAFWGFYKLHDECIHNIKNNRKVVLNSGIKIS